MIYLCVNQGAECEGALFWDEFFLLKANCAALEIRIVNLSDAEYLQAKSVVQNLTRQCVAYATWSEQVNPVRVANALLSFSSVCRALCARSSGCSFDFFDSLFGYSSARSCVRSVFEHLSIILSRPECSAALKTIAFRVLLSLLALVDNVHQNTLIDFCEPSLSKVATQPELNNQNSSSSSAQSKLSIHLLNHFFN